LLHNYHRINLSKKNKDDIGSETDSELLLAADRLVESYKNGVLPPHSGASVHLLSIYKETRQFVKGRELWRWLSHQKGEEGSEMFVSAAVYGAAIEMLAYAGEPLADLEELYKQALKRFPGTFAEYHLSPEAVVPDRGQSLTSIIRGIPILLLQGLFSARLLNGDWRNAYLAFDTALRLFPDMVPKRFFELLIRERPLGEAVDVFNVACYAKTSLHGGHFTKLLIRLASVQEKSTTKEKSDIVAMMFGLFQGHVASGGPILSAHLSQLIIGLSNLVIWVAPGEPVDPRIEEYNLAIAECGKRVAEICIPLAVNSVESTLNGLLLLGGKTKDVDLILHTCQRINELVGSWNSVAYRSLVTATGLSGDVDGLESAWNQLLDRTVQGVRQGPLDIKDWQALARATKFVKSARSTKFVEEQLSSVSPPYNIEQKVQDILQTPPPTSVPQEFGFDYSAVSDRLTKVVDSLEAQLSEPSTSPPIRIPSMQPRLGSEESLQVIYDELTVDPLQPLPPQAETQLGATSIPFDVHRFENWKAVNGLLTLAMRFEAVKGKAIDDAIVTNQPLDIDFDQTSLQLLDREDTGDETQLASREPPSVDELRLQILQLRGRV
jgi:hypothetical protein